MELMKKYGIEIQIDLGTIRHNPEEVNQLRPYPSNWPKLVWIKHEGFWYIVKSAEARDIIKVKQKLITTYNKEQFLEVLTSMI